MKFVIFFLLAASFVSPPFRNMLAERLYTGATFAVEKTSEILQNKDNLIPQ